LNAIASSLIFSTILKECFSMSKLRLNFFFIGRSSFISTESADGSLNGKD
jgi:hypothetical protein